MMKTFKHKVLAGQYKNFQDFYQAYTNHVTDWHKAVKEGVKISIEKFLGLTTTEYNQFFSNVQNAYHSFIVGDLFNIPTVEQLDYLLNRYNSNPVHKTLRFGQYVYNDTYFEFENSYNEKDTEQAYNLLKEGIKFWSEKEEND